PPRTHASLDTELQLSGRAAAMGRGVIADVASKLIERFAANLAAMLADSQAAPPEPAVAIGGVIKPWSESSEPAAAQSPGPSEPPPAPEPPPSPEVPPAPEPPPAPEVPPA